MFTLRAAGICSKQKPDSMDKSRNYQYLSGETFRDCDHTLNMNITGTWLENSVEMNNQISRFLDDYWYLSIYSAVLYVITIFAGRRFMQAYSRFDLTYTLAAWSGLLAVFSALGTIRFIPNMYYSITKHGLHDSVCNAKWPYMPVVAFWTSLFSISKIIELGDTVFIVLRKQPLIFLHWYHHITVLIYTWYSYTDRASSGRWYITMNFAVHSVMYAYYAMRALKYRAPKWVRMGITMFQLSQMVVGVTIGIYVYKLKQSNVPCGVSDNNMRLSFLMYFSYFLLFVKFFYDAYINPPQRPSNPKPSATSNLSNGVAHSELKTNGLSNGNGYTTKPSNGHLNGNTQVNGSANKHTEGNGHGNDLRRRN